MSIKLKIRGDSMKKNEPKKFNIKHDVNEFDDYCYERHIENIDRDVESRSFKEKLNKHQLSDEN